MKLILNKSIISTEILRKREIERKMASLVVSLLKIRKEFRVFVHTKNIHQQPHIWFEWYLCTYCVVYIFCVVYTKSIHFKFQAAFSLNFVQVLYSIHIVVLCGNLMYMFCAFIILQNFDLCNLCIQNIYKLSVWYNFCIHFV